MKIKEILENKVIQFKSKKQLQMDELKKMLIKQSEIVQQLAAELASKKRDDTAKMHRSKFKVIDNESDRDSK